MPQPLLVPYHPQIADGYCLAACAQMVLHFWGIVTDQEQLARQLGVESGVGAPAGHIKRLSFPDLTVTYDIGELELIQALLDKNVPVIAMVQAGELPQWQGEYFQHAVVIMGYDTEKVWLLDPDAQPGSTAVTIDEFMLAWGEMDYRYAVLEPYPPE